MSTGRELTLGNIGPVHPTARERERGAATTARLTLHTASGRVRDVEIDETQLLRLVVQASKTLAILRKVPT